MKLDSSNKKTIWERTSIQCLLRNKQSRKLYGRVTIAGKQIWFTLDTDVLSVAKLRLADKIGELEKQRGSAARVSAGKATMGELMDVYIARTKANSEFKTATVAARLVALKKLKKTWPRLESLEPKQITPSAVQAWVARFKVDGTNFVPPGARTTIKGNSASSVNRAIDTLRRLLEIAIELGQIHSNSVLVKPSTGRLKKKLTAKKLTLPSMSQVEQLFHEMENNGAHGGWGTEAADLCRFLTYSGARIGEVPLVRWQDVDWERKQIHLCGYKTDTSDRFVPLFPALEKLLKKIIERRKSAAKYAADGKAKTGRDDCVFHLKECQKSIDGACARVSIPRITHHDFRHLFATVCIESGVDIPTLAGWMGHSDGGVLAMRTYGHLRREHSQAVAQKVRF